MKRIQSIILLQALLSFISGYLISKMSFIGRLGINLFYSEYRIFKSWWQTALVLFAIQMLVLVIQWFVAKYKEPRMALITSIALLCIALLGLYGTYHDFQHTYSHRLLKEKFHLGFYLFWLAWMGSCLHFLSRPKTPVVVDGMLNEV